MTVAVGLVVLAALVVAGAAVSGSWLVVTIAAALAVALGAVALRISHTELIESRIAAARDRVEQARAYNVIANERSLEHAAYVEDVRIRLAEREHALSELELALSLSQRRAATSTRKRNAEGRRASALELELTESERRTIAAEQRTLSAEERGAAAQLRIAELETEVVALRAELDTVTTAWHAAENARKHA